MMLKQHIFVTLAWLNSMFSFLESFGFAFCGTNKYHQYIKYRERTRFQSVAYPMQGSNHTTLSGRLKRFFEPLFFDKLITIKAFFPALALGMIRTGILFLIKKVTNIIMGTEAGELMTATIVLGMLSVFYRLILIITKNRTHATIRPFRRQCFYRKYMQRYLYLDNNEVEKRGTGRLIAIIDKGFHSHIGQIVDFTQDIAPSLIQLLASLLFIYAVNTRYGLIVTGSFFFISILIYIQQKKAHQLRKIRIELNIRIMRRFVKILMSKFEILSTGKMTHEIDKVCSTLQENIDINKKQTTITIWVDVGLRALIDMLTIGMIVLFGFGWMENAINVGEFASLIGIIFFLDKALTQIKNHYVNFLRNSVEIEKLRDTFDSIPHMQDITQGNPLVYKRGDIAIAHLSYAYGEKNIFSDFSLSIPGGSITAFVGESGTGKSTLMKLIAGYIRPTVGEISIDGQALSTLKLSDYYHHIGYLTQDPSVFDGTVYENLVYALDTTPTEKQIQEVISTANCGFVFDFEYGLETEIGERGVRLSGGQKQRLAIAKIMLKNPPIILLDEPTSALDSINEEQISQALHRLFQGKTVIIIAHRLQTARKADIIHVFEQGDVVESGTHEELVARHGLYAKMIDLQTGF